MVESIILILIGTFIGWNFPQPGYAVVFQAWIKSIFVKFTSNKE
jgi:hypothetical protein